MYTNQTNIAYEFTCRLGECVSHHKELLNLYIGQTTTSPYSCLTRHLSDQSAIRNHLNKQMPLQTLIC